MSQAMLRRAGAILIAATALLHLHVGLVLEFEEYFEEHFVIGLMFLIGSAGGFIAAFLLLAGPYRAGWALGTLVAAGMLGGLVISRTVGLLGFDEQGWAHWNEPQVWLSIMIEVLFLVALGASMTTRDKATASTSLQLEMERTGNAQVSGV